MKITLEMVDEVINRTHVSYKIAKEALENNDGDILKAIIDIEALQSKGASAQQKLSGHDIVEKLKGLVNEGLVNKIVIVKDNKTVLDIPVVAGAIGAVFFTFSTVAAIVAAVATGCEIMLYKKDGDVINFNEFTQSKYEEIKAKIQTSEQNSTLDEDEDFFES